MDNLLLTPPLLCQSKRYSHSLSRTTKGGVDEATVLRLVTAWQQDALTMRHKRGGELVAGTTNPEGEAEAISEVQDSDQTAKMNG